jgi:hypothetical protein
MNDFTKEELKIIRNLINNLDEKMLTWNDEVILVQSKLQSMIDNYCEHQWVFYISPYGNVVRCSKCNKGIPE